MNHSARAKRVIFLFMAGAPSQMDLYDPKPVLAERNGEPLAMPPIIKVTNDSVSTRIPSAPMATSKPLAFQKRVFLRTNS